MTKVSQDFTVYAGDDAILVFTVYDATGAALDISQVGDIIWNMQRDLQSAVVLQRTMSAGGGITFVNTGLDGKFQVALTKSQTAALTGYYLHQAKLVDQANNVNTVTLGRGQVGRMPVSTYSGDPSLSDKDAVRFWVDDTAEAFQRTDPEILYALSQYGNPLLAASAIARSLAAQYAKLVDKSLGPLRLSYGQRSKAYLDLASVLQSQGEQSGVTIYAGGTSLSDMAAVDANADRNPPPFSRKQFDIPNAANPVTTDPDNQFNPVV